MNTELPPLLNLDEAGLCTHMDIITMALMTV